ncbi:GntR family transcriptional regulator [Amycolatopsis lurida]|uniref:GntR family transcriptional regulator n=1 Tax=Amycolatopsis lurida TaxID=31959 RepID=UPI000B88608F|nr:GntR family transcriptional regulator [Amycolatopsis lurida]
MAEPAYVSIAGDYARRIRTGELSPGTQLPSYWEIAQRSGVSDIVVRKAIELLRNQGLVRSESRRGVFVASRTNLVRISPERQMQDPETTFGNETEREVRVERDIEQVAATSEIAEALGLEIGSEVSRVVTRASEGGRPISISDTYQPAQIEGISTAKVLEETIRDRIPSAEHAEWLQVSSGGLVKSVHQRFVDADGGVVMVSDVSYPRDRYDAFVFRMTLD